MKMDEIISKTRTELHEELRRYNSAKLNSYNKKRLLTNLFFILNELSLFKDKLDPFNYSGIEQLKNKIADELIEGTYSHFFGDLYQIEYSLKYNNFPELQNRLSWTINDVSIMRIQILLGSTLDDSLGSAFFDRLDGLVNVDNAIITQNKTEFLKLSIINLCVVNRCLVDYILKINGKYSGLVRKYLMKNQIALKKAFSDLDKIPDNLSLLSFVYLNIKSNCAILNEDIAILQKDFESIKKLISENYKLLRDYDCVLTACNLFDFEKDLFNEIYEFCAEKLSKHRIDWKIRPFFIQLLIYGLKKLKIDDILNFEIYPTFDPLNVEEILQKLFIKFYEKEDRITINQTELTKLYNMNDIEIRKKLMSILEKSSYIDKFAKEGLEEEANKPHTGYEISDFEVRINEITACFPIKTGKEIRSDSVPEDYVYQIIKPFIHFYDNCVVIFITAKKCSQPLMNYIKKLQTMYKLPIAVIQGETLCKLFKFYNHLD
jgi:hypothetical protein